MGAPDISKLDSPLIAYRGVKTVTVGSEDITFDRPVTVRALAAGVIRYVDSLDEENVTGTLAAGGDVVGPGNGLVYVRTIRGATTVNSIQIGIT